MNDQTRRSQRMLWTAITSIVILSLLLGCASQVTATAVSIRGPGSGPGDGTLESASPAAGLAVGPIAVQTPGTIDKYAKFEISFAISATTATNPYFPYATSTPPGVPGETGITVDMLLLPPGTTDWNQAQVLPCFYYQPVEQVGSGEFAELLPKGKPDWRCRFTPQVVGTWQYKVRVVDASGTAVTSVRQFTCGNSTRKGFIKVSSTDPRYFEFSDGTPFVAPLINVEQGNPFNGLARLRQSLQKYGQNGVRLIRWFPTGEGANYDNIPFGEDIRSSWEFGDAMTIPDASDTAAGKRFTFSPYYYTVQRIPAVRGARYRLSFRAQVGGDKVFRPEIVGGSTTLGRLTICANASLCSNPVTGWRDYSFVVTNTVNTDVLYVYLRDGYTENDNSSGFIILNSIRLQRDETGQGSWGSNLLARSDPDTYSYIDQRSAARLDEIFRLSEQYGVYHKLPLFNKNDQLLNRFLSDGSVTDAWDSENNNFYSQDGWASRWYQRAYTRYFIARWSYSPALHSLELANENMLSQPSYDAGFALAQYVRSTSPRRILMTNSFWGWFVSDFWADPVRGYLMDYADKHWYANRTGEGDGELVSTTTNDSAANARECWRRFNEYKQSFNYNKPIVRGETGVAVSGTEPQDPDIARDTQGTYYHKQLWAQVGAVGYQCDGEWYPQLMDDYNLWGRYAAFERFMQGESVSNGRYTAIGTDLTGTAQIALTNVTGSLRAWGARDASAGKALLWIDNGRHTWRNVVDHVTIPPAGATLTVQGLPKGTYTAQWWNTLDGTIALTQTYTVGDNGRLVLSVSQLATDKAVKLQLSTPDAPPMPYDCRAYLPLIKR